MLASPFLLEAVPAADTLGRFEQSLTDGGYRAAEAVYGIQAFLESPVFGHGVGYQTPATWVDTMGYMPVGPIYHVYYVSYLANEGLVGLALLLWYFAAALFSGEARRLRQQVGADPWAALAVGLQSALAGAMVGAFFAGPSDGHWTWGVYGAAALVPAAWARREGPVRRGRARAAGWRRDPALQREAVG